MIKRASTLLAFILISLSNIGAATTISLDAAETKWQISEYLNGMHFVYAVEPDALYADERIADWMRQAKVKIIRWPGGTAVMTYHWDALTGDAFGADRWSPEYVEQNISPSRYMDLDEFIIYCRRVGAEPMVGVNIRSGHKYRGDVEHSYREARELIEYCVAKDYNVKHWYIGNEIYAKGTPGMPYSTAIDKFAAILKEVDPNIIIYADWKFGPEEKNRFAECLNHVDRSKEIDVMEIHEKWGSKWGLTSGVTFEEWINDVPLYGGRWIEYAEKFVDHVEAAGRDVKLGMNEWGIQTTALKPGDKRRTSAESALIVAEYMIDMVRTNIATACYWNLNIGPGGSTILETTDKGERLSRITEIGDIFLMSAHALGESYLNIETTDLRVRGFGAISKDGKTLQIYLLNKNRKSSEVALDIANFDSKKGDILIQSYTTSKFDKEAKPIKIKSPKTPTLSLPALSFSRVVVEL